MSVRDETQPDHEVAVIGAGFSGIGAAIPRSRLSSSGWSSSSERLILGPYGYNGQSYFGLIETQMRHIARCLKRARRTDSTLIEIREEANARFLSKMLGRRHTQVFWNDTCRTANSYYFDQHGDVPFRASTSLGAAWRSAAFDLDDYRYARAGQAKAGTAAW